MSLSPILIVKQRDSKALSVRHSILPVPSLPRRLRCAAFHFQSRRVHFDKPSGHRDKSAARLDHSTRQFREKKRSSRGAETPVRLAKRLFWLFERAALAALVRFWQPLPARNLLSRPPHRGRRARGSVSGSEGGWWPLTTTSLALCPSCPAPMPGVRITWNGKG